MTAVKITIAALAMTAAAALSAQAQDSFVLRFNHVLGPNEPFHQGFLAWADRVAERTGGRLQIEVYHSAQLGVEEDIIEQLRQGANVGQNTDAARLGNYVPGIAVVNGPYMVADKEEAFALADSPTMQGWIEALAEDHGIRVVCFDWVQGQPTSSPTAPCAHRRISTGCASAHPQRRSGRNRSAPSAPPRSR